jgi:4-amino-4-deoxy-L-arabinose transferase-like glycosyltransferase
MGLIYVVWLLVTARSVGVPRDEGVYFRAATEYVGWWRMLLERGHDALQQSAIDAAWNTNHEHPVLMKTLFGVSWWMLHEKWRVFACASAAYRFPAMCTAGAAIWTTYLFGARAWTRSAGFVAAVLLALMPRVFFHAHLACFDVPITAMWLACVYVHWRAQERRRLAGTVAWALATGLVFGLALETKHNAWLLPAVIVPHALFVHRKAIVRGLRLGRVTIPASLAAMAVVGPVVFYALWPYIWNDTFARLEWYADFHLHHEYYNIEFLGRNYFGPPSPKGYLPVMVVATVPTVTLLLFLVGAFDRAKIGARRIRGWAQGILSLPAADPSGRDPLETDLLIALSIAVAMGPFFLSTTPIFGGTKHWMPAYPFLALFAGRGFDVVRAAMMRALSAQPRPRRLAADAGLVASVVLAPLLVTAHATPFGLASYVPIVGGTAGGADLGLNRQFWGYTTLNAAVEYLNANAPLGATVFISDTTWEAWARMQEEHRVRGDLRAVGAPHESQLALVQHELHMNEVDYSIWVAFGTAAPVYVVTHDGVPIVSIYKRR